MVSGRDMTRSILTRDSALATAIINWVIAWSVTSALIGIVLMLAEGVAVYLIFGCWPIGRNGGNAGTTHCSQLLIAAGYTWLLFAPMAVGGLLGLCLVIAQRAWVRTLFPEPSVSSRKSDR
jgi:hypothetical protein